MSQENEKKTVLITSFNSKSNNGKKIWDILTKEESDQLRDIMYKLWQEGCSLTIDITLKQY